MDVKTIINKYGLVKIEKGGRQGVQPLKGNPTAADIEFIRAHKDEIIAILDANKVDLSAVTKTAADVAYAKVAAAEVKYRQAERNEESAQYTIAARDAYLAALREWQAQYPEEAAKSTTTHYNDAPTNPWNI